MQTPRNHKSRGFTLVEIMVVVAIIALLSAVAVPSYLRSRKRTQASRVLEDLRVIDQALDRWAIDKNKVVGEVATFSDLAVYFKDGSKLTAGFDILGNSYGNAFSVDTLPKVPGATYATLSDVAPAEFWSPYN